MNGLTILLLFITAPAWLYAILALLAAWLSLLVHGLEFLVYLWAQLFRVLGLKRGS